MSELEENRGPGANYEIFLENESLCEKLKLLNYEKDFIAKERGLRPITRFTFAIQNRDHGGEQFTQFTKLTNYLLKLNLIQLEFDEFDDPGTITSQILESARRLKLNVDFPASKLRGGHGSYVINLMNQLADVALVKTGYEWAKKPQYPREDDNLDENIESEGEDDLMEAEDEDIDDYSDDDTGAMLQFNESNQNFNNLTGGGGSGSTGKEVVGSKSGTFKVDPEQWREEAERLAPQFKITLRADQKNWRQRIETLKQSKESIEDIFKNTVKTLTTLTNDIGGDLDKTRSREKYINRQLESLIDDLRSAHDRLAETKELYESKTSGIAEKSSEYGELAAQLESVKAEMEERGQMISDGKPLVRAKQAMTQLQRECCELDVHIATIEHELSQSATQRT